MYQGQIAELLRHGKITTTLPKAKEVRSLADKVITLGKDGTLESRRQAMAVLKDKDLVARLFDEIAKRYANRNGGYTRVIKAGARPGDAAPMAILELVEKE